MRVVLTSAFRDSTSTLRRYFDQVDSLRVALQARGDQLQLVLAEGDSTDGTWDALHVTACNKSVIVKADHGGPVIGSIESPQRWRQLKVVSDALLDAVAGVGGDAVLHVEQDLLWEPGHLLRLLDHLHTLDAVAPMVWYQQHSPECFYDTAFYRKNGTRFTPWQPYHPALNGTPLVEVDCVGSCFAMRFEVSQAARWGVNDCIAEFWQAVREKGFRVWIDQTLEARHP